MEVYVEYKNQFNFNTLYYQYSQKNLNTIFLWCSSSSKITKYEKVVDGIFYHTSIKKIYNFKVLYENASSQIFIIQQETTSTVTLIYDIQTVNDLTILKN